MIWALVIIVFVSILSTIVADVLCDFTHGSCCPESPDSVTIADYVTVLPDKAFDGCKTITSVVIGKNVKDLGYQTFHQSSLTSITIPEGVTHIGFGVFSYCTDLTEVKIPSGPTKLWEGLFEGCLSLVSVVIPDTVTEMNEGVFTNCKSLKSIIISKGMTNLPKRTFLNCISLTSVVIPSGVNNLDDSVFEGCTSLTSILIPNSVLSISPAAFSGCSSLSSVTIGSGMRRIRERAFFQCTYLTSIVIPSSVNEIEAEAFMGCTALASVVINSATLTANSLGSSIFQGCSSLTTVTVPNALAGAISPCTSLNCLESEPSAAFYDTPMAYVPFDHCPYHPDSTLVTFTAAGSVTPACLGSTADTSSIPIPVTVKLISASALTIIAAVAIAVAVTLAVLVAASVRRVPEASLLGLGLSKPSFSRLWINLRWVCALIILRPVATDAGGTDDDSSLDAMVWDASDMSEEFSLLTADQSPLHSGQHQPYDPFSIVQVKLLSQIHKLEEDGGRHGMALEGLYTYEPPQASIDDKRSELGHGTFGVTYRKKNVIDGQLYAVKVLRCIDSTTNYEARFLQVLNHPNIVKYFASFKTHQGSELNIVMELVDGCPLSSYIHCTEPPSKELITKWLVQTLGALRYLHDGVRILHRDIKPDNILVCSAGQDIKLIDLGLATVLKATLQSSRTGSSQYASYEKLHFMKYDGRDDIWAVGCVWSELITRKPIVGNAPLCLSNSAKILQRRVAQGIAYDSRLGGVVAAMLKSSQADIPTASQCLSLMDWAAESPTNRGPSERPG